MATAAATDKLVLTFDDVPALMCGAGLTDDWFENDPPLPSMDDRPLRDGYSDRGIRFRGPSEHEGATVVSPVCGGSDVEIGATSGSHALELNDHNVAKPPETIWLDRLYGSVSLVFWATDSLRVSVEAYRGSQQVASTVTAPGTWEYVGVILRGDQVGFDRVVLDLVRNEDWEWLDLPTCPVPSPLPCRDERSGRPLLAGYLVLDDLTFWPLGESPVVPE